MNKRTWLIAGGAAALAVAAGAAWWALGPVTYYVDTGAMSPNLKRGDVVEALGSRFVCGLTKPKSGDVVVFRREGMRERLFGRVVAQEGASVAMDEGRLLIDGQKVKTLHRARVPSGGAEIEVLAETLPSGASYRTYDQGYSEMDTHRPMNVPRGTVFILGDNRDGALDSREAGPIPHDDICGVVVKVVKARDPARVGAKL